VATHAQVVFRTAKREVEVHGQKIPMGKLVLPMIVRWLFVERVG
jgi:cytochrome P450